MFERFTDRARRVIVLAQEYSREMGHDYIGTEHILLGIISEGKGVGAKALEALEISPEAIRTEIEGMVERGTGRPRHHIPFKPRAKRVLELSLREALQLGHRYIGTEHILLGLIREGESVGARVLVKLGADVNKVRAQVISILQGYGKVAAEGGGGASVSPGTVERSAGPATGPRCPGCSADLDTTAVYKILDVPEHEGDGKATVLFLYCKVCGAAIDDIILPDGS